VVASTDGAAASLSEVDFSALALRFFADFESTGTVPAVDILTGLIEDVFVWGQNPGFEVRHNWSNNLQESVPVDVGKMNLLSSRPMRRKYEFEGSDLTS
jgi:hypothetical protein